MLSPSKVLAARRPGTAQVPVVEWTTTEKSAEREMRCPNCDSLVPKTVRLIVRWKTITDPVRRLCLLYCSDCTSSFFEHQRPPDYTEPSLMEKGRVPFYIQQGAGISLLTRPLARLDLPPDSLYLDVGCGFGFGLDFAVAERGWAGSGIDPAPLAAMGREVLGLDIASRYLKPSDAAERVWDVVMSSETIEHVLSPRNFVRTLRWALKPGGVLVLTTPDADKLRPSIPPGTLVPLLSPGLHMVFQNRVSLRALLARAGFPHVLIENDGYSIVAYASDKPLELEGDPTTLRTRYRSYLERRAASAPPTSDLFLAMAARALAEAVSDGDMHAAGRTWAILAPACRSRFGIDLDDPVLPPGSATKASLERLADIMPLNLATILYSRVMLRLAQGATRADVEPQLRAVVRAAETLRGALHDIAIDDVQTADLAWTAHSELALCAADRSVPNIAEVIAGLPDAPGEQRNHLGSRRGTTAVRAMTALVNGGRYELARELVDAEQMQQAPWAVVEETDVSLDPALRDGLFCLAVLDLQPQGDLTRARGRMRRVQAVIEANEADPNASGLFQAAQRGELQAVVGLRDAAEADRLRGLIAAGSNAEVAVEV